ncbi:MAG: YihY/virulence factor BrkB family protein [Candidatus Enterenecus sp.]
MKQKFQRALAFPPVRFVADIAEIYFSKQVGRSAAQLAYFLTMTFFPILICVSAFVSKLNLTMTSLLDDLEHLLPEGVFIIFRDYLGYLDGNLSTPMLIAGVFLAVFSASAAIRGLMSIMREIFGRSNFTGAKQIVASVIFAILLLVTIYLSLAVVVTGNWFFHLLGSLLGLDDLVARVSTWQWIKYLLLLVIVFLFILLLYRFVAPLRKPRPPVVPGAFLAAVALAAASLIFSMIVSRSTRYSLVYGSLASIIILLVWLYLCSNIFILGNVVNYVIDRHRKEKMK